MAIDRSEVERIALLARLELADADKERMAAQLSAILDYVAALQKLDLSDCAPTHFAPANAELREDAPDGRGLTTDQALAAAPDAEDGFFLVPPVVENIAP